MLALNPGNAYDYLDRGRAYLRKGDYDRAIADLYHLETPGVEINLMSRRVRDRVLARTNNAQEPFTYGSLPGEELFFKQAAVRQSPDRC
jgi:uncharacterized caspase-like protein